MPIHVVVDIDVVPGKLDHVRDALGVLVTETLTEPGCSRFEAYLSEAEENRVVLVETWADQHAIDLHMKAPYTLDFIEKVKDAFVSPPDARRIRLIQG